MGQGQTNALPRLLEDYGSGSNGTRSSLGIQTRSRTPAFVVHIPAPDTPHDTDELARRFWTEVVEDYRDRDAVRCGLEVEEGLEDFSSIGRAFITWVRDNGKNIDQLEHDDFDADEPELYVRNDHCLIIDERALAALETLPESPPAVKPLFSEEWDMCFSTYQNA